MSDEQLGFDPTIITAGDERYIEIEQDGVQERLIIDQVIRRGALYRRPRNNLLEGPQ